MSNTKRCPGYKGHWECGEEYPDHIVPIERFNIARSQSDGRTPWCRKCMPYRNSIRDSIRSAVEAYAKREGIVADQKGWRALPKSRRDEVFLLWSKESNVIRLPQPPQFDNSYEEITTVTKGRKRDQKVVTYIRNSYNSCAVDGCEYSLFDVAHIHALKHGADDLPGNCIPLCPNHHRDLDRGMLRLSEPNGRSASEPIEFELNGSSGKVILNRGHEVDSKYVKGCINEISKYLKNKGDASENAISKS
jgi:hypothetical protein